MSEKFDPEGFLDDLNGRDTAAALAMLADDVEWHVPGDPAFGGGVYRGLSGLEDFTKVVEDLFPEGLERVWTRVWHADHGAIMEATLDGKAVTGKIYHNNYAFVFVLNDEGKIREVREYQDIEPLRQALEGWQG